MKLVDIALKKTPLNLRSGLATTCPLGNAALLPVKGGYLCSYREFLYDITGFGFRNNRSFLGITRKWNIYKASSPNKFWLVRLDGNFKVSGRFASVEGIKGTLEDVRLFEWGGAVYASGTTYPGGAWRTRVCRLDASGKKAKLEVVYDSPASKSVEKNWMAVPDRPGLMVRRVAEDRLETVDVFTGGRGEIPFPAVFPSNIHGNSPLLRTETGYLMLVHTKSVQWYVHMFVELGPDLVPLKVSPPFVFDEVFPVEMSVSVFRTPRGIGVSVCENDAFQYVYEFDEKTLMSFVRGEKPPSLRA